MNRLKQLEEHGFDIPTQERAREYQRARLLLAALESLALLGLLLLFAAFGSAPLRDWLSRSAQSPWSVNLLYTLIFGLGLSVASLVPSWRNYQLERRYGLSVQPPRGWLVDELKSGAILLVIFLAVFPAIYSGIARSNAWWVTTWAITTLFIVVLSFIAPVILMPLFYKFVPLEDRELTGRLERLVEKAGVKVLGVFKMAAAAKTRRAVGALAGIGRTRRIILSDTLLENYTPEEIETVVAHELGHHAHRDMWKLIAGQSALALLGLYAVHLALEPLAKAFGLGKDIARLPLFLIIFGGVFFVLSPLSNSLSRWFEGQADQYALQLAKKPAAQARVMVKICDQNLRFAAPHLLLELLAYDHPAGIKRVERVRRFLREAGAER
ncbi:MAG: M48 family metallopeptidase [Candidatus Acetothermia bacterium]|jgi:STE24 endopeptidase|nr:M48 family metallopeptidase [Candidatus Acetothermia bacterium]MDH7504976.1 M48 family metallopeptidase [Candidatus Acetothermia bacterium]